MKQLAYASCMVHIYRKKNGQLTHFICMLISAILVLAWFFFPFPF